VATAHSFATTYPAEAMRLDASKKLTLNGSLAGTEISATGVTGTGKAICVKSDGNFGVCADAVGAGGTCTCG
jgi:hypothetical protein